MLQPAPVDGGGALSRCSRRGLDAIRRVDQYVAANAVDGATGALDAVGSMMAYFTRLIV